MKKPTIPSPTDDAASSADAVSFPTHDAPLVQADASDPTQIQHVRPSTTADNPTASQPEPTPSPKAARTNNFQPPGSSPAVDADFSDLIEDGDLQALDDHFYSTTSRIIEGANPIKIDSYEPDENESIFYAFNSDLLRLLQSLKSTVPQRDSRYGVIKFQIEGASLIGRCFDKDAFTEVIVALVRPARLCQGLTCHVLVLAYDDVAATLKGVGPVVRFSYRPQLNTLTVDSDGFHRPIQIEPSALFVDQSRVEPNALTSGSRTSVSGTVLVRALSFVNTHVETGPDGGESESYVEIANGSAIGGHQSLLAVASDGALLPLNMTIHHDHIVRLLQALDSWTVDQLLDVIETETYFLIQGSRVLFGFLKSGIPKINHGLPGEFTHLDPHNVRRARYLSFVDWRRDLPYKLGIAFLRSYLETDLRALLGVEDKSSNLRVRLQTKARMGGQLKSVFSVRALDRRVVKLYTSAIRKSGSNDEVLDVSLPLRSLVEMVAACEDKYVEFDLLETNGLMRIRSDVGSTSLEIFSGIKADVSLPLHERPWKTKITELGFTASRG